MKVAYLLQNPGLARCTPEGWDRTVVSADSGGEYASEDLVKVAGADILVVGLEPVTEELLEAAGSRLRLIQRLGVGYDNVDLEAARRRGVPVCYMPDFNAGTVAEHAIALMLGLLRRLFESTLLMKAGRWPLGAVVAAGVWDLQGKTVGVIGMGRIGQEVGKRLLPFGVRLQYHDERRDPVKDTIPEARSVELEELLRTSDIVSLHLPLTPETRGVLGREELELMKPSALLVNTARGALVDEGALAALLDEGRLAGAGVDVFSEEPPEPKHPLRGARNVLLTPHTAGQTREAMQRMVDTMLANFRRIEREEAPLYRVL